MRPRNKFEQIVAASNEKLPAIDEKAIEWAIKTQVKHLAFRTSKKITTCGDCGSKFHYKGKRKYVLCPHCGKKHFIMDTLKRTSKDSAYFSVLDTIDDMQVQRVFLLDVYFKKGKCLSSYNSEVCRLWLDSTGKKTAITGLKRTMGYYLDSFDWNSEIELRRFSDVISTISDCSFYPKIKILPQLNRNGMSKIFNNCHPFFLMQLILTNSKIETIAKAKDSKAIRFFVQHPEAIDKCWDSYKVAKRNGYVVSDYSLWTDLIYMLNRCGKDVHSPRYVCPNDLQEEHDYWMNKIQAINDKERRIKELIRAKEDERSFYEEKSRYFGIVITDDDLVISVLDSIEAYLDEGNEMHHCVFSCGYYKSKDSLILSAHDRNGQRIETVEYSLKLNKVVQCYGKFNKPTTMHDRIINLVNSNSERFVKAKASA